MSQHPGLSLRPYQLACAICALGGEGAPGREILDAVRANPDLPITLQCNAGEIFAWQDPGHADDTPESEEFNLRRDLEILHRLNLFPGAVLPAHILFLRLLETVEDTAGFCGYGAAASEAWQGCPRAGNGEYRRGRALGGAAIVPPRDSAEMAREKAESLRALRPEAPVRVRPHVLLCALCQYGSGTRPPYPEDNLPELLEWMLRDPDVRITLAPHADWAMCAPCPYRDPTCNGCVNNHGVGGLSNQMRDLRVLQKLDMRFGDTVPARDLYRRLFTAISGTLEICRLDHGFPSVWATGCGAAIENSDRFELGRQLLRLQLDEDSAATVPPWSRPIRIPEAVEITHADPPYGLAGAVMHVRLPFVLSREAPAGARLHLQLWGGRDNRVPFVADREGEAGQLYVAAELADGRPLAARPVEAEGTYELEVPDGGLPAGTRVTVRLEGDAGDGFRVSACRQLNKFFVLYVPPELPDGEAIPPWSGGSVWAPPSWDWIVAACTMHVLGGRLHHLRAYAPSSAAAGEEIPVLVRPEDAFDNLSSTRPASIVVEADGTPLPARFDAAPGTTCLLGWVRLPGEGVFRLTVRDDDSGMEARTNPIVCPAPAAPAYWGMIHGHTEMSDGTGTLDTFFHQLRREALLDFAATADHDHRWETPDDFWRTTCARVRERNADGEFVVLPGYEWAKWRRNGDGDRNVYYLHDDRPMYRSDDGDYPAPPDLFRALAENEERAIVIPHHTAHGGNWCDWKDHHPGYERLVEIFQCRGSYECAEADGNPAPELPWRLPQHPEGYVRHALALGWRVGFTAGGDDHDGLWGTEARLPHYRQGLTCVEAEANTRDAIFAALYHRRAVATTGARVLLTYRLSGHPMGSELSLGTDPGLAGCRSLAVDCHGTAPIDRLEIIRNNAVVHVVSGDGALDLSCRWDDMEPLAQLWLPAAPHCDHPFVFYYVRAVQQDGEVAWASPCWIDP